MRPGAALLLWLTAAWTATALAGDGCPDGYFLPIAGRLCVMLTDPAPRDVAVGRCYRQADRFEATAWQLRDADHAIFRRLRDALVRVGTRASKVWLEADASYPGGVFLHGYAGNSLYNTPVRGLELRHDGGGGDQGSSSCVVWDVPSMTHHPVDCAEHHPAVCLAEFSAPRLEVAGCPEGFRVAPRVWPSACVNHTVTAAPEGWSLDDVERVCREAVDGAHLVQRTFPALYSTGLSRSYNCPMGARLVGGKVVWTDYDGLPEQEVEQKYLKKLLGGGDVADADMVGQVYLYNATRYLVKPFGPQWRLVDANSTFNCMACEVPLPARKEPAMNISLDGSIIRVSVENPEFLLRINSWSWSVTGPSVRLVPRIRCYTDALTFYPIEVYLTKSEPHQVTLSPVGDGYYWCVGYDVFTTEPIFTDKVLVRSPHKGVETFAVQLRVAEPPTHICERFQVLEQVMRIKYHIQGVLDNSKNFSDPMEGDNGSTSRPAGLGPRYRHVYADVHAGDTLARTLFDDRAQGRLRRVSRDCANVLLHVRTPPDCIIAPSIAVDGFYYTVSSYASVDICSEDVTEYQWPPTIAGSTAALVLEDGTMKRTCEINYDTGAFWGEEIFEPLADIENTTTISSETTTATENNYRNSNAVVMSSTVSPSTTVYEGPTPASQQELSGYLKSVDDADDLYRLSKEELNTTGLSKAVRIMNSLLKGDVDEVIEKSKRRTTVLHDVKTILSNVKLEGDEFKMVENKIAVFVADIQKENEEPIRSMILTSRDMEAENTLDGSIETAEGSNASMAITQRRDVDVAVLFPEIETDARISVAVYSDTRAFRMRDMASPQNFTVNSRIVSIDIESEENGTFVDERHSIEIFFRPLDNLGEGEIKQCVFWEFKEGYVGRWSSDGCELVNTTGGLDVCRCHHLTHFAEIITSGGSPLSKGHQVALDVISMVGCALSLAGVAGIVVTAVMFPAWRRQLGNKLLLCLSAAVAVNMIMFLLVAIGSAKEGVWCIIAGVGLHYSVLASFCWMLVSAWLQYRRLVEVLVTQHVSHLILKVSLFSWGFPLIIITILLCISPNIYTATLESGKERGFCFPTGHFFYWGVLAPVVLVVLVNIFIFFAILKSIYNCCSTGTVEKSGFSKRHLNNRRLLTGVLLFFLLGLTWVFGFLSRVSLVFTYLFCITATMQGMVLFLFFIAGEKKMRDKWFPRESSVSYSSTRTRKQSVFPNSTTGTFTTSSSDERTPLRANIPLSQITKITEW